MVHVRAPRAGLESIAKKELVPMGSGATNAKILANVVPPIQKCAILGPAIAIANPDGTAKTVPDPVLFSPMAKAVTVFVNVKTTPNVHP